MPIELSDSSGAKPDGLDDPIVTPSDDPLADRYGWSMKIMRLPSRFLSVS